MRGLPAINRAARLRAEAIASLRLRCWSGEGLERRRLDSVWQAKLFAAPANPLQSRFIFWDTIGESLAYRNNAYIWMNYDPLEGQIPLVNGVGDWWALHPDQVQFKDGKWVVKVGKGYIDPVGRGEGEYRVGDNRLLHIRGHGGGGTRIAPTPIELFREAISAPVNRQRHETRMWRRGTSLQVAVILPEGVSKEDAEQWREMWKATYEGSDGDTTAVLGGGADIKPIGMSASDAQFAEMSDLTVRDAGLIMGVPESLLRIVGEQGSNIEADLTRWLRFGLAPELERIESALFASQTLFGGAQTYPQFDTERFIRGDIKTEFEALSKAVQAGWILPDEARLMRGLDELPDGAGKIPQITPVGGAPNPAQPEPPVSLPPEGAQRARNGSAPDVHVYVPDTFNLGPRRLEVERDSDGLIKGATVNDD